MLCNHCGHDKSEHISEVCTRAGCSCGRFRPPGDENEYNVGPQRAAPKSVRAIAAEQRQSQTGKDEAAAEIMAVMNQAALEVHLLRTQIATAIEIAQKHGGSDESHHLHWVIDQMTRILAGDGYDAIVAEAISGENGPSTYAWKTGIAP